MLKQKLKKLEKTPPRCLRGFRVQATRPPEERGSAYSIAYKLTCRCGCGKGRVLGYSLADYNKKYSGPLNWISPLAFACLDCGERSRIIDTDIHGWHPEVGYPSCYRGKGKRRSYPCPDCQGLGFTVIATFAHAGESLERREEDLPMARQDGFSGFQLHGKCLECGKQTWLAGFDL